MRVLLFCFLLLFLKNGLLAQSVFFETYPDAKKNVVDAYDRMDELKKLENENGKILFSIVAPEVAMYSSFMDFFETTTAEIFYVNIGEDYGNFSLGQFQMKPSFAEEIERDYNDECNSGAYLKLLSYKGLETESEIREERIVRMKSEYWQQIYLICFYEIMEQRYAEKKMNPSEKVAFYAAAYNYGYNSSVSKIENWMNKISFPGRMDESIVSYSDLATEFLMILYPEVKSDRVIENEDFSQMKSDSAKSASEEVVVEDMSKDFNSPALYPTEGKHNSIRFVCFSVLSTGLLFALVFLKFRKSHS